MKASDPRQDVFDRVARHLLSQGRVTDQIKGGSAVGLMTAPDCETAVRLVVERVTPLLNDGTNHEAK